ncbi:MAG: hypothetical protein NVS4B7_12940 [Ktedonobacteraceae bacterium]
MAQSEVQISVLESSVKQGVRSDKDERRLRRTAAWMMLFFLLQGELGAIWDREWHFYVGRDWFWTPPHTLIYSCVAGAGLIALVVVLTDTMRYYRRRPGVDDTSTIPLMKVFHAPIGFVLAGIGALGTLIAAPLDNYWHEMYGIDVALWAPFHLMGISSGLIAILGMIYIFASEVAHQRTSDYPYRRLLELSLLEWGTLFIIAGLINFTLIGFLQSPIAIFGLLIIPTYGIPLVLCGTLMLIAAVRFTHLPGAALLTTCLLLIHTFLEELFVPWAIRTGVAWQGLAYRVPEMPYFKVSDAVFPVTFLVSALIIDGVALWRLKHCYKLNGVIRGNWLLGILVTLPQLLIAPCIIMGSWDLPRVFLEEPSVIISPDTKLQVTLIAVPILLVFGILGAFGGATFGDIWYFNKR